MEHVEDLTQSPEMLGGRVKTLHPRIHAGILARRDEAGDMATLAEHGIEPFDLVCVNLYPFEESPRSGRDGAEAVEMIDVGGPSMLRGARRRTSRTSPRSAGPTDYDPVLEELRANGELSLETRRRLAAKAFAHTAAYDAAIATWFTPASRSPTRSSSRSRRQLDLAYGENPHQRAAYYAERGARRHLLSRVEQLHGKELSFNNLNDLSGARSLVREFDAAACVIVKHANPCGVALGATLEEAYDKALASDPISAYGGVVVFNREVGRALGEKLAEQFVEVSLRARLHRRGARRAASGRRTRGSSSTASAGSKSPASGATSACSAACSSRTPTPRSTIGTAGTSSPAR